MIKIMFSANKAHDYSSLTRIALLHKMNAMAVIVILLSVSLAVALFFLGAYLWSVRTGQFDDDFSPAQRILFEDKPAN